MTTNPKYFWYYFYDFYSDEDYSMLDIVESDEQFGNVTAHVYTMNGERNGSVYENYKLYTYNDVVLKISGKIDGNPVMELASIYMT